MKYRPDGTAVEVWAGWYRPDPSKPWRVKAMGSTSEAAEFSVALLSWPGEWMVMRERSMPDGAVDLRLDGGGTILALWNLADERP